MGISGVQVSKLPGPFDVIVIGGGINGTGIARDAAERGLKVLMLEKNDLGAGTTAYSTRLIHGGLRYLENMEISLVRESLRERERLLKNAPHLVKPLELGIPIYKKDRRGKLLVRLGMMLYGFLSWDKSLPGYQMHSRDSFLKQFQGVNPQNLVGGASYYDAQIALPERICVENAIAAQQTNNAVIRTHAQVDAIRIEQVKKNNHQATGVEFTDLLTGERCLAEGKVIINAAGPWVDQIANLALKVSPDFERSKLMGGTKGSHIIVKRFPGGPERAIYVEAESDGRPYFIIPWQLPGHPGAFYLIGTTDLHYKGDLDKVVASEEEIEYLLKETNRVLPAAKLSQSDILYTYSGVRPLPNADGKSAGKITRKHVIADHPAIAGLVSIVGGKLTTYRNLAEETVDHLLKTRRFSPASRKTRTREQALPGAVGIEKGGFDAFKAIQLKQYHSDFEQDVLSQLLDLYGARYQNVLDVAVQSPDLKTRLTPTSSRIAAQVKYAVESEFAQTLTDVMRRMGSHLNAQVGLDEVEATAAVMAQLLNWSDEKTKAQVTAYRDWVETLNLQFKKPAAVK